MLGWKAPARRTDDFYALTLASDLLLEGDSSRLYQRLVKDDESVVGIQGGMGERRGPSSLYIFAIPKPGHPTVEIRRSIDEEFERLATEGPSAEEMEKLRNTMLNDAVRGRQSTLYRAQRLAEYALYDGDPHFLNTELERYLRVTPGDIGRATRRYLLTDNHSLMEVVPAAHAPVEETAAPAAAATPTAEEPAQPGAPPPQVPAPPAADAPSSTSTPLPSELASPAKPDSPPPPSQSDEMPT